MLQLLNALQTLGLRLPAPPTRLRGGLNPFGHYSVDCFPLDCSQIVVSLLCMRGWPKMKVAKFILGSSAVVLVALSLYSFLGIASGDPTASLAPLRRPLAGHADVLPPVS